MELFPDDAVEPSAKVIPWTLDRAIATFLHRWAFAWRGENAVIERELRELVAEAVREAQR